MMSEMLSKGIDMGDIYFQNIHQESWTLEDGLVKNHHTLVDKEWVFDQFLMNSQVSPPESLEKIHYLKQPELPHQLQSQGKQ